MWHEVCPKNVNAKWPVGLVLQTYEHWRDWRSPGELVAIATLMDVPVLPSRVA
jgi:hypothetical protein